MIFSIIGLGGTGSYLTTPLIRYVRSKALIDKIIFADGDKYDEGNIHRQDFMTSYVGENKAKYSYMKHCSLFPELENKFEYIPKYIGIDNLDRVMHEGGAMFICVDNYYFRKIADDKAKSMNDFILISCGNEYWDGQVQTVQMSDGKNITNETICSRHSEISEATTGDRSVMTCEEVAALPSGGQIIAANMMAATLALCHFINVIENPAERKFCETFFDTKSVATRNVEVFD